MLCVLVVSTELFAGCQSTVCWCRCGQSSSCTEMLNCSNNHLIAILHVVQVYTLCVEALADVPSCGPALDTLAQYYLCLASLCAAHGDKQRAKQAAGNASQVLAKAAVADPMRALYWKHRVDELQPMIQLSA